MRSVIYSLGKYVNMGGHPSWPKIKLKAGAKITELKRWPSGRPRRFDSFTPLKFTTATAYGGCAMRVNLGLREQ